jgi:hypothetical protein
MNAVQENLIQPVEYLDRSEILKLAAVDAIFYGRQFFPKTMRQESPEFHRDFWNHFEDPTYDFFAAEIFRGGAKTTLTRIGISKRVAFAISRNILCVAISEDMAVHSIRWLKKQIEQNHYWTDTFLLRKGDKWTDDWIEIINTAFDCRINIIAKGMTSGLRGLNPDDWRPDFIFCDDISNEETTGTEAQLRKNSELFFGALVPSLAPKSEAPMRKLVLAQTGLNKEDIVNKAHTDPSFHTVKYPKLIELEDGRLKSAWPSRFSVEECVQEKEDYIRRNQLHVYLREYGCKIISRETAPLDYEWLKYWKSLPTDLVYYVGLDPAISKNKTAHRTSGSVIGVSKATGDVYLIEYFAQKGKNPDEMWIWFKRMYRQYRPRKQGAETVAFQKFLAWYFKKQMEAERFFFHMEEVNDKRSKPDRIIQALSGLGSQGKFWVNENHTEFISGWSTWDESIDWDLGDATAQAITLANPWLAQGVIDGESEEVEQEDEKDYPDIVYEGGAP